MKKLEYIKCRDYLIPALAIGDAKPQKPKSLGKYGRMRLIYLRDFNSDVYNEFLRAGKLQEHLLELNDAAHTRLNCIIDQMMKQEGVTEQLKATDQMRWVQKVIQIRATEDEIVRKELVYA